MSGRLEQRWKGERFRMLDPASLPEKPVFPKPPLFLGLGAVLGLFVGIGASLVAEYLDPTVKDSEVLQAVQGYPAAGVHPPPPGPRRRAEAASRRGSRGRAADPVSRRREAGEKPWGRGLPGEAAFRDEGIVTPEEGRPDHREPGGPQLGRRRGAAALRGEPAGHLPARSR